MTISGTAWEDEGVAATFLEHYRQPAGIVRKTLVQDQILTYCHRINDVMDVGSGDASISIGLVRSGQRLVAIEPSLFMREALTQKVADYAQKPTVEVVDATIAQLVSPDLRNRLGQFDLVLCHGVIMYLSDWRAALHTVASFVRPNGTLSLLIKNAAALALRPAIAGDFASAKKALDEDSSVGWLGVTTHGHRLSDVADLLSGLGFGGIRHYGVGVATDHLLGRPGEVSSAQVEVEAQLAERSPYRDVARLLHILATRVSDV